MPATKVAVQPLFMKDCLFRVGTDAAGSDFEAHLSGVTLTPTSASQSWKGLTPTSVHTDATTATWQGVLAYAQDWENPDSLSRFLYEHEGEEIDVVFKPRSGVGPSFAVTIIVTPGSIGGTVDAFATASVTVGCKGRPELVPVTP